MNRSTTANRWATRRATSWPRGFSSVLLIGLLTGFSPTSFAESEYAAAWGPSVGAAVPMLAADDQAGNRQTFDTLKGSNGLLFVFNRSVDW